jgi:hypothetical protein
MGGSAMTHDSATLTIIKSCKKYWHFDWIETWSWGCF